MAELGRATLVLDTDDRLEKGLDNAKTSANKLNGALGGVLKTAGGFALAQVGMQSMSQGFDLLIGNAANFEESLHAVQAASGATSEEMALMRKEALGIGKDTSKTASEAVQAMGELVKAGMPVQDVIGGVARSAVQFAEATGITVPQAATIMSDAMHTFSATGTTAAGVADTFSRAAAASSISVHDLQLAMAAVGPVAASAGLSVEDFATSIALMGNNGLKSSDAGTSLKAFIAGLTPSSAKATKEMKKLGFTAFDSSGNFKDMRQIVDELSKAMSGLTEEQKATTGEILFGSDGIRAMHVLTKEGATGWDALTAAQTKQLSLQEQSRIRMQGLNGQLEILRGSIETLSIMGGTLLIPMLTQFVKMVTEGVNALIALDWSPVVDGFNTIVEALEGAGALEPILAGLAAVIGGVLLVAVGALTLAAAGFVAGIIAAAAPVIAIGAVLGALALGIKYVIENWDELNAKYPQIQAGITMVKEAFSDLVIYWNGQLLPALTSIKDRFMEVIDAIVGFVKEHWPLIKDIVMGVVNTLYAELKLAFQLFKDVFRIVIDMINGDWDKAWQDLKKLAVNAVNNALTLVKEAFSLWKDIGTLLGEIGKALIDLFWEGLKAAVQLMIGYQGLMYKLGLDIMQGLWDGLKSLVPTILGWAEDFIKSIPGKFTDLLGIGSPSKVMYKIGEQTLQGLVDGLADEGPVAEDTVLNIFERLMGVSEDSVKKIWSTLSKSSQETIRALERSLKDGGGEIRAFMDGLVGYLNHQDVAPEWIEHSGKLIDELGFKLDTVGNKAEEAVGKLYKVGDAAKNYNVTNPGGTKTSAAGSPAGSSGGGSSGGGGGSSAPVGGNSDNWAHMYTGAGTGGLGPVNNPIITDPDEIARRWALLTDPNRKPMINNALGQPYWTSVPTAPSSPINVTVNGSILTQQDINAAFTQAALAGGFRGI